MMALAKLIEKYPNLDFWANVKIHFKLNSLLYFVGEEGDKKLSEWYAVFHLPDLRVISETPQMLDQKIGPDIQITKPKTLKQLLN